MVTEELFCTIGSQEALIGFAGENPIWGENGSGKSWLWLPFQLLRCGPPDLEQFSSLPGRRFNTSAELLLLDMNLCHSRFNFRTLVENQRATCISLVFRVHHGTPPFPGKTFD